MPLTSIDQLFDYLTRKYRENNGDSSVVMTPSGRLYFRALERELTVPHALCFIIESERIILNSTRNENNGRITFDPMALDDFFRPVEIHLTDEEYDRCVDRVSETDSEDLDTLCGICLEKITTNHVITTCGHDFHDACLREYLTSKCQRPVCPMCRHDVREPCPEEVPRPLDDESDDDHMSLVTSDDEFKDDTGGHSI